MEMLKLVFTVSAIVMFLTPPLLEASAAIRARHHEWMAQYGRSYASYSEKEKRFGIFKQNLKFIEKFNNAGNNSYKMGLNHFADLTEQEFIASHTGLITSTPPKAMKKMMMTPFHNNKPLNLSQLPISLDWRDKRAVTPVKNQGTCGSCWAFAAVAAVEGLVQIRTGMIISLSEQQVIDCASYQRNQGCKGGIIDSVYPYIIQNHGLSSEANYPYHGIEQICKNPPGEPSPTAQIKGYVDVVANNEEQLLQAVANQPVSIAVSASGNFRFYKEGVFTGPCDTSLNHTVAVIGYGVNEEGIKYWIVKNSWGEGWGESGFMRLQRDSGLPQGLCGLAMEPSYPTF